MLRWDGLLQFWVPFRDWQKGQTVSPNTVVRQDSRAETNRGTCSTANHTNIPLPKTTKERAKYNGTSFRHDKKINAIGQDGFFRLAGSPIPHCLFDNFGFFDGIDTERFYRLQDG